MVKIHVKIKKKSRFYWVHFCYVPKEIKQEFDSKVGFRGLISNDWVIKWATQDFGFTPNLDTPDDLNRVRAKIKELYREKYPELYLETNTDKQGWLRVWYTNHMLEEMGNEQEYREI